jgi:hypothetical protein
MLQIPISAVPNQALSFNADGAYWQLHIFQAIESMCVDVRRNGVDIITGVRAAVGDPVMPYPHMYQPLYGNFVFDGDVDWTTFGAECRLFYMSADEFKQYQALVAAE